MAVVELHEVAVRQQRRQSGAVLGHMIRGVDGSPYYQVRSIAGGAWSMPAGNPAQALELMPPAAVSS